MALEKELWAIAGSDPVKFAGLVRDRNFWALGKVLPFVECHAFIAGRLYPDDGYAATAEQRKKCSEAYIPIFQGAVTLGYLPMINPHTKVKFDPARLVPEHFQNGLIMINLLSVFLRKEDQSYIDQLRKKNPETYRVSQTLSPIMPIRGGGYPTPPPAPNAALELSILTDRVQMAPARSKPKRLSSDVGEFLTPVIWNICYDMREAGQKPKPATVIAKLRKLADRLVRPLVGSVARGVKFELEGGEESEVNNDAVRKRISGWRKTED